MLQNCVNDFQRENLYDAFKITYKIKLFYDLEGI